MHDFYGVSSYFYMVSKMKKRLALLSILLVAGLVMAGIATVSGASSLLKFAGKEVRIEAMGEQLKIYENGKVVKEIPMPEGEYTFTIEAAGHRLLHKITVTKGEIERVQPEDKGVLYKITVRNMTKEEIEKRRQNTKRR